MWIQSDAKEIVEWIENPVNLCGSIKNGAGACREWINKAWMIRISHAVREQNKAADIIARIVRSKNCDWMEFKNPPDEIKNILQRNRLGMYSTRGESSS